MISRKFLGLVIVVGVLLSSLLFGFAGRAKAAPISVAEAGLRVTSTWMDARLPEPTSRSRLQTEPVLALPATAPPRIPLLQGSPVLTITKTADPDPAVAGNVLTYTIVVENGSITDATGVIITDTLDTNVTFASASDGGSANGGMVTWNPFDLNKGLIATRTVTVTVSNISGDTILSNTAGVTCTEGASASITINTEVNAAPTDIALSNSSVAENQASGTTVGAFSTTDSDTGDTHTYSLVDTATYPDNTFFIIGSTLRTTAVFDHFTKSSYTIRVRTTDTGGLFFEKEFTISVTDVLPTISISKTPNPSSVLESGAPVNFTVLVTNTGAESVTLNSLTDSDFGNLNGQDCTLPQNLPANNSTYSCFFTRVISGNFGGPAHQNTVTASASDNESNTATNTGTATVTFIDVPSSIQVTKTVNPTSVNEPGGIVNYTIRITNTSSVDAVTINSVTDNKFGDIGSSTCSGLLGSLAVGQSRTCNFDRSVAGQPSAPHTNIVTASGIDDDGLPVSDNDSATVTFNNLPSFILVDLNTSTSTVPETGGTVDFTVRISNGSVDSVTINSLTDSLFGNLNSQGNCSVPWTIPAGSYRQCTFSAFIAGDAGGVPVEETVTASGLDDDGGSVSDSDTQFINFSNVNPNITVTKTANPTSVPENGGNVTFTVFVSNTINEAATLNVLTDTVFVNLNGRGTCTLPQPLSAYGSYTCSFTETISGNAGGPAHVNMVYATATDDEEVFPSVATDDATVTFTNVQPNITVTKTANPLAVTEPGEDVTFTISVRNNSTFEAVTLNSLTDNKFGDLDGNGNCVVGGTITPNGGSYSCSFTEFVGGYFGDPPHVNTVTARVADDDGEGEVQGQDNATVLFGELKFVFLPLLMKAPPTFLYVTNLTGGPVTFTVIGTSVNNCSIATGEVKKFCGSFTSGTYNVYITSICGPPQTLSYTYPPGEWTNEVYCK
jgi:uncharacterized repeat protein (TIGR01451 family)